MSTSPKRTTERLLLRRWQESDREPFAAMNADPAVMRYFPASLGRAASDRLLDSWRARFDSRGFGMWALELLATGELLGATGLNPMPAGVPGEGGVEVGWRLARSAWGHGYATEAARTALKVGWAAGLPEIWSLTAVLNLPSQAVMRRIGMQQVATADHPSVPADSPLRPHVFYRVDRPTSPSSVPGPAL